MKRFDKVKTIQLVLLIVDIAILVLSKRKEKEDAPEEDPEETPGK